MKKQNLQVCVTGANGFIGRNLVDALFLQGYSIRVLTRRSDCVFRDGVQVVRGDLTSPECPLAQLFEGCEVVFHCAGEIRDVTTMRLLHVDGTERLIKAALKEASQTCRTLHWVQLSSVGAYGPPFGTTYADRIVTEDTPPRPVGEYEITKTRADEFVMEASNGVEMTYSILRPSNVFGAKMTNQSLRGLIQMVKRRLFFYIGKPGAVATYIHVDDVVAALVKCAFEPNAKGRIYNLSNDCLLEDLINHIALLLGVHRPRLRIPEILVRSAVGFLENRVNTPLTTSRLDALSNRTHYPVDRIASELGFSFCKPLPAAIEDLM
jgi:nucleoside-diphosphate-sugar epimerase